MRRIAALAVAALLQLAAGYDNGAVLGKLPPRGWATWCTDDVCGLLDFCEEAEIHQVADALVSSGMAALGYDLILLDDCWSSTNRSATGELQPDAARFPSGIPALVTYVKAKGLHLGLYTCAGTHTCKFGRPGSYGHYEQDAATLVGWGVEWIKADNCDVPSTKSSELFGNYSAAINATGVPVVFHSCQWGLDDVAAWGPSETQVYRINPDHLPFWRFNVPNAYPPGGQGTGDLIDRMANASVTAGLAPYAFPDPDFLMTGLFQTPAESRTEFAFWALWSAPMLVATDVRNMTADKAAILTNADVLGVQRDPLLAPAVRLRADAATGGQLWAKPLASGGAAVILFNANDVTTLDVDVRWAELGVAWAGAGVTVRVYDAWAHDVLFPAQAGGATAKALEPHGSVMWLLTRN